MSCSNCGSTTYYYYGCGCSTCSNCSSGCSTCSGSACCVGLASPAPYYASVPMCQEDSCQKVYTELFSASIKTYAQFVVPECGGTVLLNVPETRNIPIGAWLWNPTYGRYQVVAFDCNNQAVTVLNDCTLVQDNPSAGTTVPSCINFIVSDSPCPLPVDSLPFLSENFTAPAALGCVTIQVTTTYGIEVGDEIYFQTNVGTGSYEVSTINSLTEMIICENGNGITPGVIVPATDIEGGLITPIYIINSNLTFEDTDSATGLIVNSGATTLTRNVSVSITNPSNIRGMIAYYNFMASITGQSDNCNSQAMQIRYRLQQAVDGAAYINIVDEYQDYYTLNDNNYYQSRSLSYTAFLLINPGQTRTIDGKLIIDWIAGPATELENISIQYRLDGIGVI